VEPGVEGAYGLGQELFRAAVLPGWYAVDDPDVGVGLEGLYPLVDGAADFYWERGVRVAVFQNFRQAGGNGMLEIQHFGFRGATEAGRFLEDVCRNEGGEATRYDTGSQCLFSVDPTRRALLGRNRDVVDVRLYGNPGSDPVVELVRAFHRMGPGPVGGE